MDGVPDRKLKPVIRRDRHAADAAGAAAVRRLGRRLHPVASRRGDGDGAARRRAPGVGPPRPAGGAPIRCPRPGSPRRGAGCWTRWPNGNRAAPANWRGRPGSAAAWCAAWRMPGCWFRAALPVAAAIRHPRPGASRPGRCRPIRRPPPRRCAQAVAARDVLRHAAGRRHRLRQDRGLPGGGRRVPAPGPPGAGAAAGDRAVLAMAGALRAPLRRRARRCGTPT